MSIFFLFLSQHYFYTYIIIYGEGQLHFAILQINDLEIEKHDLRKLRESRVDMLKRNKRSNEAGQTNRMISEIDNRRKLSDLINKKMENTKVKILRYKTLFAESIYTNNGLESCTKGMQKHLSSNYYLKIYFLIANSAMYLFAKYND